MVVSLCPLSQCCHPSASDITKLQVAEKTSSKLETLLPLSVSGDLTNQAILNSPFCKAN